MLCMCTLAAPTLHLPEPVPPPPPPPSPPLPPAAPSPSGFHALTNDGGCEPPRPEAKERRPHPRRRNAFQESDEHPQPQQGQHPQQEPTQHARKQREGGSADTGGKGNGGICECSFFIFLAPGVFVFLFFV